MQRCLNIDPPKISLSFILHRDLWILYQFSCVEITYLVRLGHSHVVHHGGCSGQNDDVDEFAYAHTSIQSTKYRCFCSPFIESHHSTTAWRLLVFFSPKALRDVSSNLIWSQLSPAYLVISVLLLSACRGSLFVQFFLWHHLCFVGWSWYREGQR